MMDRKKKAIRLLAGTLAVYALLVATHLGEFWPFSIYPMFSKGGQPWSRAVVRTAPPAAEAFPWRTYAREELPGAPYPLRPRGIDPIDLANFVSKTRVWHPDRVQGLRRMFADDLPAGEALLVMRVDGRISPSDEVTLAFVPYALVGEDTTYLHPDLPR